MESHQINSKDVLDSMDRCTKCGICNSYCPVANNSDQFPGPKYSGPQAERFRAIENVLEISSDLCNGCGICMSVCPNNVAITDIIAHSKSNIGNKGKKITFLQKLLNRPYLLGKIGNLFPPLSNFILHNKFFRWIAGLLLNLDSKAPLPYFAGDKFKKFSNKTRIDQNKKNIFYFSGCAVDNYDPEVGIAASKLMSFLGYNVLTNPGLCCSLPMFSSGEWDVAEYKAKKLISSLSDSLNSAQSIISTSTSCSLTIKKKYSAYINFSDEISTKVSKSIFDICEYLIENHFEDVTKNMNSIDKKIIYHGPCQLRNHGMGQPAVELLRKIPNISIHLSEADCCGVGGTFGYIKGKGDISRSIGRGLMDQVEEVKPDLILCDSETCRWNIEKSSGIKTIHPIQLILESLGLKNQ